MDLPYILIVEDEHALSLALAAAVKQAGFQGEPAPTAARARKAPVSYTHLTLPTKA